MRLRELSKRASEFNESFRTYIKLRKTWVIRCGFLSVPATASSSASRYKIGFLHVSQEAKISGGRAARLLAWARRSWQRPVLLRWRSRASPRPRARSESDRILSLRGGGARTRSTRRARLCADAAARDPGRPRWSRLSPVEKATDGAASERRSLRSRAGGSRVEAVMFVRSETDGACFFSVRALENRATRPRARLWARARVDDARVDEALEETRRLDGARLFLGRRRPRPAFEMRHLEKRKKRK